MLTALGGGNGVFRRTGSTWIPIPGVGIATTSRSGIYAYDTCSIVAVAVYAAHHIPPYPAPPQPITAASQPSASSTLGSHAEYRPPRISTHRNRLRNRIKPRDIIAAFPQYNLS